MSVRSAYSLSRMPRLHVPEKLAGCLSFSKAPASSAGGFSMVQRRHITWGFVGLGQMGRYTTDPQSAIAVLEI